MVKQIDCKIDIYCFRFSSGDLSSECDDVDPNDPTGTGRTPPLQQQPMPNSSGGPPNMPPPPAPTRVAGIISTSAHTIITIYFIVYF